MRAKASPQLVGHAGGPRCRGRRAPRGGRTTKPWAHTSTPSARPVSPRSPMTSRMSGPATARACARRSARRWPSRPTAAGRPRSATAAARLAQLVGVGVVDQHPLGQRVGGEQHLVLPAGSVGRALARRPRPGSRGRRARGASVDRRYVDAALGRRRPRPARGTADAERREVRRQHEADDRGRRPASASVGDGVLDERARRASGRARPRTGPARRSSRAACERGPLGLGALGERARCRRWRRSGPVRSASCSGGGRPAPADVGVVGLDVVGRARACRRP